jgi:hypothetical protein
MIMNKMTRQEKYLSYKLEKIDKKARKLKRMWASAAFCNANRYIDFKEIESEIFNYQLKKIWKILNINRYR